MQVEGSRRNIEEHYDAGNAMYKLFLDSTLTYSSGIHRPGPPTDPNMLSMPLLTLCRSQNMHQKPCNLPHGHDIQNIPELWGEVPCRACLAV